MSQGPPRHWNDPPPPPRNSAGTYGLATTVPCPLLYELPLPEHALVSNHPCPQMENANAPEPIGRLEAPAPRSAHFTSISWPMATPIPRAPSPLDEDSPSPNESEFATPCLLPHPLPEGTVIPSIPTASTMSGLPSPTSTEKSSAPTAPRPGSYEDVMLRLTTIPETKSRWTNTLPSTEETPSNEPDRQQPSQQEYSPIEIGDYMVLQPVPSYRDHTESEPSRNSATWRSHYMPSLYNRETTPTWTESTYNDFDHFHYDEGTFRDQYHGPRTSCLVVGQGDNEAGGSNQPPTDPPQPSHEECLLQTKELLTLKERRLEELQQQLEEEEQVQDTHANLWRLNPSKGKKPDLPPPPPVSNKHHPLFERDNRWSVP
ncbi:hypothetical protein ARMSODRAFT_1026417 [Armillaria solidipes]|uniref:Uncharacterized protein n=1 Tax=Armillaria solidipes TaxID=1076256 RepID=A0A2H3B7F8_9AGAR|nr:hypothetical protein ARMSODRAFT_1026417 [Armillaria solidipes]